MWKLIKGYSRIIRPLNCLMFFVGTSVGGIIAAGEDAVTWPTNRPLLLAALAATLVGASGNVLNDVFDVEIDRTNRPGRPLPSGLLTTFQARALWIVLTLGGLAVAAAVSWTHVWIAAASVALLFAYNARLKSIPVAGNMAVSIVVAVSLIFGALALAEPGGALPAAVFALLATLAREVLKDVEDLDGDRAQRSHSLAVTSGPDTASRVASALLLVTIGLTPVPFLALDYSGLYLLVILLADGLLLAAAWSAVRAPGAASARRASRWTKAAMAVGLAALALSGMGPA